MSTNASSLVFSPKLFLMVAWLALPTGLMAAAPVANPPPVGSWQVVKVESPTTGKPQGPADKTDPGLIVSVVSRASGGMEERVATFASGKTRTIYRAKSATIAQLSPGNPFFFLLDRDASDFDLVAESGFFGCAGIKESDFVAEEIIDDVVCRRFDVEATQMSDGETVANPKRSVWIDAKTRKPVALRIGNVEYRFTINEQNPGKPRILPEARKVWEEQKNALAVAFGKASVERTPFDD